MIDQAVNQNDLLFKNSNKKYYIASLDFINQVSKRSRRLLLLTTQDDSEDFKKQDLKPPQLNLDKMCYVTMIKGIRSIRSSIFKQDSVFRTSNVSKYASKASLMSTTASTNTSASQFCMDLVKEHDYDNYLCGLLLPKSSRQAYFAIRAFNCEIARIKDTVKGNVMTGAIRFTFWNDMFDAIYAGNLTSTSSKLSDNSPIVQELVIAIENHNLTQRLFGRCIEARHNDLHNTRPETLADLENYSELAHSSILYLLLQIMNIDNRNAEFVASHVGVCSGLVTLLRGTAFHANEGNIYIPRETANRFNLIDRVVMRGPTNEQEIEALRESIYDTASQAHAHLDRARVLMRQCSSSSSSSGDDESSSSSSSDSGSSDSVWDASAGVVPTEAVYALLPAVRSSMVLEDLQKTNFNPFDELILGSRPALGYQVRLLKSIIFKSF